MSGPAKGATHPATFGFKRRLSELLIAQGLLPREQAEALMAEAAREGKRFVRLLVERHLVSETKLTELLSQELGLPMLSLANYRFDASLVRLLPERVARQYHVVPLSKFGERLVVAMADPLDLLAIDDLKTMAQTAIDPVLAPEGEILRAIEQLYANNAVAQLMDLTPAGNGDEETLASAVAVLLNDTEQEAPVVRVINLLVKEAVRRHASDIHIEPQASGLRVRFRIDGHLLEVYRLPAAVQSPLLTRLKIMSGLDITEWRLPQDGRFKARLGDHEVDFRVSILPISHGGKVVLRLLDKANLALGLEHLGFLPDSIAPFEEAVKRPFGMILVTGPTGSGKSTTLYSVLQQLNHPTKNLVTIEDPVEYQIEGITQVQAHPEVGLTFAAGLRSILRQNPDVVMIGEIRDFETADIAMKSSLTGHLVLSTLHTNDAASAVTRLIDMGVEPFLVASSVSVMEAQRLVRKLCEKCRQPVEPPPAILAELGSAAPSTPAFYEPKGCRLCRTTGFHGRVAIVEVIPVDERVRELIVSNAASWQIRDYAVKERGIIPIRQDGLRKAAMGLTTLEEVTAVTSSD